MQLDSRWTHAYRCLIIYFWLGCIFTDISIKSVSKFGLPKKEASEEYNYTLLDLHYLETSESYTQAFPKQKCIFHFFPFRLSHLHI